MRSRRRPARLAAALLTALGVLGAPGTVRAATITFINNDSPGEGFNDPTPKGSVEGNDGATLGEQRLNVLDAAANYWGSRLGSDVEILVAATMDPLECDSTSGVLGSGGAGAMLADFPNAPLPSTWYPVALANSHAGTDLCPPAGSCDNTDDIIAQFNSDVDDDPNCLTGTVWYYGIGPEAPSGTLSFFNTVVHDLAHGLGFATVVDLATGAEMQGIPDVYERHLEDHSLGLLWPDMTDTQRQASAVDTGDLHWIGDCVARDCVVVDQGADPVGHIDLYAPNPLEPAFSVSHWDTPLSPDELMEPTASQKPEAHLTRSLMTDIGWRQMILSIEPVGDANGSGSEDLAVLATDSVTRQNFVYVMDGSTGAQIQRIFFTKRYFPVDMEVVSDFGGTDANEVAVLLLHSRNGTARVMTKDAQDGALLGTVFFSSAYLPLELEAIGHFGGSPAPEIAVLAQERGSGKRVRVSVKDASSGAVLSNVHFSKSYFPMDLEIVGHFGGSAADELALLARSCATQAVVVDVKDASTGSRLNRINFSKSFIPVDLEVVPDLGGASGTAADEIAVIGHRVSDDLTKLRVKDAGNAFLHTEMCFSKKLIPIDLEVVDHYRRSPADELAVLSRYRRDPILGSQVSIKDAVDGDDIGSVILNYPRTRDPWDLAILPFAEGPAPEFSVFFVRYLDGERRVITRDPTQTGAPIISSIPIP